jgi:hypothetical protein
VALSPEDEALKDGKVRAEYEKLMQAIEKKG